MGENSKIQWTTHTFNPWIGCTKVSPGCANCYAERDMAHRFGKVQWGPGQPRVRTTPGNWSKPLAWDCSAAKDGVRPRVFCSSLADVFDHEVDPQWRADLFTLIRKCSNMDWLLLTKRPENLATMLPVGWLTGETDPWPNVWLGTTVEDQARADTRIPLLLKTPAAKRFLSCEPLLGAVDLRYIRTYSHGSTSRETNVLTGESMVFMNDGGGIESSPRDRIDWIIVGGESGPKARPMHPEWARSLRDQAQAAGIAFHFKQWGEWAPIDEPWKQDAPGRLMRPNQQWLNRAGGQGFHGDEVWRMERVGKANAGRLLDGRTWDGVPA